MPMFVFVFEQVHVQNWLNYFHTFPSSFYCCPAWHIIHLYGSLIAIYNRNKNPRDQTASYCWQVHHFIFVPSCLMPIEIHPLYAHFTLTDFTL